MLMTDNVCVQEDSGQYQCDPSASYPQHVNVHVIDTGEIFENRILMTKIL